MADEAPSFTARRLIRGGAAATLATAADGQPFAALVTPAAAPDLTLLLWLSTLSEHTRHLMREPRCALLFAGAQEGPNPQTAPRVAVTGLAERLPEGASEAAALKARWLARHPYAALYAGFSDFALWRIRPVAAQLVGGFARATRLRAAELLPDPAAVAAIAAAEAGIMAHVNADHADAVEAIASALPGGGGDATGTWRLSAVDVDGCDLSVGAEGGEVRRLHFRAPVADAAGVREELVWAARQARAARAAPETEEDERS